jgi:hypothetical protein
MRQRGRDRAAAVTLEQASEERKRKTAAAQRSRADPARCRVEAKAHKWRTRMRRTWEAKPYHTDGTAIANAVHACLGGSQLAKTHRLNTLCKDSREHELAIQDIIADIERFAFITDEDRTRMAYTFSQAVGIQTVVVCGTCGGSDPDLKRESVRLDHLPPWAAANDFLAHLNTLPTFELLKMLTDGTLEAVAAHRRDVHHVCQPTTCCCSTC